MHCFRKDGFVLIEACICLLCILLSTMLIHTALTTYAHIQQLPDKSDEEELKAIYES